MYTVHCTDCRDMWCMLALIFRLMLRLINCFSDACGRMPNTPCRHRRLSVYLSAIMLIWLPIRRLWTFFALSLALPAISEDSRREQDNRPLQHVANWNSCVTVLVQHHLSELHTKRSQQRKASVSRASKLRTLELSSRTLGESLSPAEPGLQFESACTVSRLDL